MCVNMCECAYVCVMCVCADSLARLLNVCAYTNHLLTSAKGNSEEKEKKANETREKRDVKSFEVSTSMNRWIDRQARSTEGSK